jgi:hypothetical protein
MISGSIASYSGGSSVASICLWVANASMIADAGSSDSSI